MLQPIKNTFNTYLENKIKIISNYLNMLVKITFFTIKNTKGWLFNQQMKIAIKNSLKHILTR